MRLHGTLPLIPSYQRLLALPLNGIVWSDWGSRHRLLAALVKTGYRFRLYRDTEELALGKANIRLRRRSHPKKNRATKFSVPIHRTDR